MEKISTIFIFSSLFIAGLAHGSHFSQAIINQFKSMMGLENLFTSSIAKETTKRNMSPLDDLFENTVISKRSAMDATDRSFFQQLGNVLTAPFKHNLWTLLFNKQFICLIFVQSVPKWINIEIPKWIKISNSSFYIRTIVAHRNL